jgi:hypothetical protein
VVTAKLMRNTSKSSGMTLSTVEAARDSKPAVEANRNAFLMPVVARTASLARHDGAKREPTASV